MKIGKLPESVLIRSVLKEVGHRREEVLVGPSVGQDCAVLEAREGEVLVLSSDPITGTTKDIGSHSVYITANDLAASGAEPVGIMLTILLTPDTEEAELKDMMRGVEKTCKELNIEVMGGHTEITQVVRQPLFPLLVWKNEKGRAAGNFWGKTGRGFGSDQMDWTGRNLHCCKGKRSSAPGAVCAGFCGNSKTV